MLSARRRSSSSTKTVSVARRRCIIVSLSRGGVSRRWCSVACLPRGWGGVRDWMSVGKKTHVIGTKNVFLFLFAKKKPQKKRAKERYFTTQTSGLFNTEHQSATHHEPKNHHRAETGTDDDVPNAHHRTRRGFFRKPLAGRRLAPFFCRGNFPISDWKSRQVEKRRTAWRKEKRWPEKQSRVDSRRCASFPRFFAIRRRLASKRTIAGAAHPTAAGLF